MSNPSTGTMIQAAREKKQWKPATLARVVGIDPSRLSRLESDERYPSREEWERLDSALVLGPFPIREKLELPSVRKRWFPTLPEFAEAERPLAVRLHAARKLFGHAAESALAALKARPDRALCEKFLEEAKIESGYECMFWLKLLAGGALPGRHSPLRAGFRKFSIVDPACKESRGDLRFPCLDLILAGYECLIFPQVTLDTRQRIFRLDALAFTPPAIAYGSISKSMGTATIRRSTENANFCWGFPPRVSKQPT